MRRGLVLLATSLGVLIAQVDTSVVTLAVKRIGADFGATVSGLQWTIDLYNLVYASFLLTGGALGIWASCNGLAFIVGPTLGGLLVETAGWRSIFYLILPLCAWALLLAWRAVPESAAPGKRRLDLPGQAAAIAALGGFAFAAIEGARLGWRSAPVAAAAALGVAGSIGFVALERRSAHGLVPLALFRSRPFSASLAIAAAMTFGMYALLFLVPLYLQNVRGDGPRAAMACGMAAMGVGELALAFASSSTSPWLLAAWLTVVGVGLGLNTAPVNHVAVASVPSERSGTASGLLNTARMVGATLGVAFLGAVFAHFAGQEAARQAFLPGFGAALGIGGAVELAGAIVAIAFVPTKR